jgi:hypothetical protein
MKRMLGTKPLWLLELAIQEASQTLDKVRFFQKQCAGSDIDQGRRLESIKVEGETRQSERHILVQVDQTSQGQEQCRR